jgi:6-phosphogluconolactonase
MFNREFNADPPAFQLSRLLRQDNMARMRNRLGWGRFTGRCSRCTSVLTRRAQAAASTKRSICDLGADQVTWLKLGRGATFADARTAWRAPPGSGPRQLLFRPRRTLALVLSELAATLTLLEAGDCELRPAQTVSTRPADFRGENVGGHPELNVEGTRAYVSNRGYDSMAVFAIEGNRLELLQHVPSGGAHPRHLVLREDLGLLVAAHEKDGRITLFAIAADGSLAPMGKGATVPGACFVLA